MNIYQKAIKLKNKNSNEKSIDSSNHDDIKIRRYSSKKLDNKFIEKMTKRYSKELIINNNNLSKDHDLQDLKEDSSCTSLCDNQSEMSE